MTDYSAHLILAREQLHKTEVQAALGNLGMARIHADEAAKACAEMREAIAALQVAQDRQRGS
jgi:hypothetical protein